MVKAIMHGCNGKMGQVISGLIAADPDIELVAGIDARDDGHNQWGRRCQRTAAQNFGIFASAFGAKQNIDFF